MPREIKMPKLSDTMEEGTLNVWRKAEGDRIEKGDILLEIETDKADMEFEAYMSGSLAAILVPAGETVPIGTPIAVVRLDKDSDEDLSAFLTERGLAPGRVAGTPRATVAPAATSPPAPSAAPPTVSPTPAAPATPVAAPPAPSAAATLPTSRVPFFLPDPDRVRATPRARVIAREKGVDLSEILGSGPEGAVLVSDVDLYLEALEVAAEPEIEGDVRATPVAMRIGEEMGVDLSRVKGTGPGGRITKRDIRLHLEREQREGPARSAALFGDELKLSQKRKFLIRNMVESKSSAPHFYLSVDVGADALRAFRDDLRESGAHITYTHLIMKACAVALERHPQVNATYRDGRILRFNPINIALAVDVQDELVAPVIKDCQGRTLPDLAAAADALIQKAREKKLSPDDYSDGTFTISNLGMMGVDSFHAIITPPQSTVLSVGSVRTAAVIAESGGVEARLRMTFGLACDHRVLDGAKGARFLAEIKNLIEAPGPLAGDGASGNA